MSQLSANGVTKRFGGITAVDSVSLTLAEGEIHGLIGPNGSGKTTLLNLLSGYYPIDGGTLALDDAPLTLASVQQRALRGIARTFQKPRLLGSLSAWQNVMLGSWMHSDAGFVRTALSLPAMRRREREARELAYEMLCGVGLEKVAERPASMLDHAEQRFLEIARGLAMRPRFILLDEPAGGLTEHEIEQLALIVDTVRGAGVGVLIVEHHTDFVFRLCDRVTTLNLGRMIAQGSPQDVRNNAEVIRVYLGAWPCRTINARIARPPCCWMCRGCRWPTARRRSCTAWTCACTRASSWSCWAAMAPARPRCCTRWPA